MSRLTRGIREAVLLILIAAAVLFGMDWLRTPQLPENLTQQSLHALQGEIDLTQLSQQRPVLVYVWASWCSVCKLTTPTVASLSQGGTPLVSVALRSGNDASIAAWQRKKGITGIAVNDENGALGQRWHITATPTFLIVYRGKVVSITSGWTSSIGLKLRLWWAANTV